MLSRREILECAFNRAVNQVDISRVASDLNKEIIRTSMQAYAARKGLSFTTSEINYMISNGLTDLHKAGEDYRYQDWSMLR